MQQGELLLQAVLRPHSNTFEQEQQETVTTPRMAALKTEKQGLSAFAQGLKHFPPIIQTLCTTHPATPISNFKKTEVTTTSFRDGLKTKTGC